MAEKSLTYLDLAAELRNERHFRDQFYEKDQPLELLFACGGVKLVWIKENGTVSTVLCNYKLQIARTGGENPSCFLQILADDEVDKSVWIYPLVPNVSPCLRYGRALIFPDLFAADDSSIVILTEDPAAFDALSVILFGALSDASDSIAEHILKVAFIVSKHCIENAERTNSLISKGAAEFVKTVPKPMTDLKLPNKLVLSLAIAKATSEMTVGITNALVSTIQVIKMGLSHYLARQMAKHGTKLLPKHTGMSHLHDKRLEEILEICMSLNEAHITIEKGLTEAAAVLKKSLNENSLVLVEHIYGQPTAKAIREIIETKHNSQRIASNLKRLMMAPKDVVAQVLTSAGKEALSNALEGKHKIEAGDSTDSCCSSNKKMRTEDEDNEDKKDKEKE